MDREKLIKFWWLLNKYVEENPKYKTCEIANMAMEVQRQIKDKEEN